jgi:hypothetical protein
VAPTRNTPSPEPDAQTSGFTEDQRSELRQIIEEVVGRATPPAPAAEKASGPRRLSDSEWDSMSDRAREGWVRELVDSELDRLARDDEVARQRADIDALKADKTPEPEAPPSVVTKIQKFLWGEPEK